jgi:serine/threonine-protein kinase
LTLMSAVAPGTRLGGFEIEALLGVGGMASVYRAYQASLDRRVALKVLAPELAANEDFVRRFQREGVHLARLEHEAIVTVYEAGREAGQVFLAMQLIEGTTLKTLLAGRGPLSAEEVLRLLSRVADALEYAHRHGFVHRDVKPANILIDQDQRAYLSDFGITKYAADPVATATGHWMGSPAYLAPEQAAGGPVDHRADVYALGCVAFECLTGIPPYSGTDTAALLLAHAGAPVPSAAENNPAVSARVDEVLRRALAKDPAQRYDSAGGFIGDLALAATGRVTPPGRLHAHAHDVSLPLAMWDPRLSRSRIGGRIGAVIPKNRLPLVALVAAGLLALGSVLGLIATSGGSVRATSASTSTRLATHRVAPRSATTSTSITTTTVSRTTTVPPTTTVTTDPAPITRSATGTSEPPAPAVTTTTAAPAPPSTTVPPPAAPYASISGPTDVCDGTAGVGPSYTYSGNLGPTVTSGYWLDASGNEVSGDPHIATYDHFYGTGYSNVRLVVYNSVGQSYTAVLSVYSHPC